MAALLWSSVGDAFAGRMSLKKSAGSNHCGAEGVQQQWTKLNTSIDSGSNVKFAGEEAKDRLYEPKHKKKLVRVLTVVAYIFFVSLAAIMLSLYYVFLWSGNQKEGVRIVQRAPNVVTQKCAFILGRFLPLGRRKCGGCCELGQVVDICVFLRFSLWSS